MSQVVMLPVQLSDLQRLANNLDTIEKELDGGPQPVKTHQMLHALVKSLIDLLPEGLLTQNAQSIHSQSVVSAPTPASISRAPTVLSPAAPGTGGDMQFRRRGPAIAGAPSIPVPAPIEQPMAGGGLGTSPGAAVVAVDGGVGTTPEAALEALQRVGLQGDITAPSAMGQAIKRGMEHPLPNAG